MSFRGRGGRGGGDGGRAGGSLQGAGGSKALSFGRTGGDNKVSFGDDGESKKAAPKAKPAAKVEAGSAHQNLQPSMQRHVTTIMRDDGTEFPQKLNNKVFVDGLPYLEQTEGPNLEALLTQFVTEWRVGTVMHLTKKDGQGFGYLAFRSPHSVETAVSVLNGRKFLGRALRVQVPKERKYGAPLAAGEEEKELKPWVRNETPGGSGGMSTAANTPYQRQALLSDLSKVASPEIIREALKEYAPALEERVEQIKIMSGGRKAFVTMYAMDDVEGFVNFMNGFKLLGRRLGCESAQPPGSLAFSTPRAARASGFDKKEDDETTGPAATAVAPTATSHAVIAGGNADKKFPMPDLLGGAAAAPAAAAAKPVVKGAVHTGTGDKPSKYCYDDGGSAEIIVGGLTDDVSEREIRAHFSNCGKIKAVDIIINEHTRQPMGLAKVTFAISAHARFAVENLNTSRLGGAQIRVDRPGDEEQVFVPEGGIQPNADNEIAFQEEKEALDVDSYVKHYGVEDKDKFFETAEADAEEAREEAEQDADDDCGFETVPSGPSSKDKTAVKKVKRAARDKKNAIRSEKEIAEAEAEEAEEAGGSDSDSDGEIFAFSDDDAGSDGEGMEAPRKKKAKTEKKASSASAGKSGKPAAGSKKDGKYVKKEKAFSMDKTKSKRNEPKFNAKQKKRRQ